MFKDNERVCAGEIINAGKCNLSCEYCYIPKTKGMDDMHEDIVRYLDSGAFMDVLEDAIGDKLQNISLWGTEPTLTLPLFTKHLDELFRRFPRIIQISFSSNFIKKPDVLLDLVKALPKDKEKLVFKVQYSIDGPAHVTDKTRGLKNATRIIMANVIEFVREVSKLDLGLLKVILHGKSTWDEDIIKFYYENENELELYYKFFDNFFTQIDEVRTTNENFEHHRISSPWLAIPGKYTVEHGRMLATLTQRIHALEDEKKFPMLYELFSYDHRIWRMFYHLDEYISKPEMFSCSAGDSNWAFDHDRKIHPCHRSFYMQDERYLESLRELKNERLANWDIAHYEEGRLEMYNANQIVGLEDSEYKQLRLQYHWCGHHHFVRFRIENLRALIRLMARAGQTSEAYLHNPMLVDMAAAFIVSCWSCPVEHLVGHASQQVIPLSQIRITCNGVFEELLRRYYELHRAKR